MGNEEEQEEKPREPNVNFWVIVMACTQLIMPLFFPSMVEEFIEMGWVVIVVIGFIISTPILTVFFIISEVLLMKGKLSVKVCLINAVAASFGLILGKFLCILFA